MRSINVLGIASLVLFSFGMEASYGSSLGGPDHIHLKSIPEFPINIREDYAYTVHELATCPLDQVQYYDIDNFFPGTLDDCHLSDDQYGLLELQEGVKGIRKLRGMEAEARMIARIKNRRTRRRKLGVFRSKITRLYKQARKNMMAGALRVFPNPDDYEKRVQGGLKAARGRVYNCEEPPQAAVIEGRLAYAQRCARETAERLNSRKPFKMGAINKPDRMRRLIRKK